MRVAVFTRGLSCSLHILEHILQPREHLRNSINKTQRIPDKVLHKICADESHCSALSLSLLRRVSSVSTMTELDLIIAIARDSKLQRITFSVDEGPFLHLYEERNSVSTTCAKSSLPYTPYPCITCRTTFGLTAFTINTQRVSTVRAKERTLLWELDKPTFELFKDSSSDIKLITNAAERRPLRRLLQDHFLFNRLGKLGLNEVDAFFVVKFRAGEDVFKQGDAGDNFYITTSGELERHIRRPKGRNRSLENGTDRPDEEQLSRVKTLHPGQSFGELSLMYNAPRSATIRARTDSECWAISAESYHRLNLGGGTPRLHAIFRKNASVERDNEPYMTREDLLRFTGIDAFPEDRRERLSALLVSLVTSNRASDPIMTKRKRLADRERERTGGEGYVDELKPDEEEEDILMDYWEFVRFDIVLNNPNAETDFAFRLADKTNTGFISLNDMEDLLQDYAEIDQTARKMLMNESSRLRRVFGRHGTKTLSAKEFQDSSKDILPHTFRNDVKMITTHMLNMDVVGREQEAEAEDLTFIEPDGAPSVIGSHFMSPFSRSKRIKQASAARKLSSKHTKMDCKH